MNDKKLNLDKRESYIKSLSNNIIESAVDIVKIEPTVEQINEIREEVTERLQYESSSLLNEAVTKLHPTSLSEMMPEEREERSFERFGKNFRYQHMLMFVSVITLIVTGMPLKFPEFDISKFIVIDLLGGLHNSTLIHRIGAVGLIIVGIWHLIYSVGSKVGRRDFFLMIPNLKDASDFMCRMRYYIGKEKNGPKFGRFSFIEKFDYWAVYWGMVIMIGSGAIMWFKELFPKYFYDIGREMHSDEGLLATLSIIIWHFYNVHFNPEVFPMSWTWWHGQLTETEMKHHHPLEYEEIIKKESLEIIKQAEKINEEENG